ncbi:MAG: D-alanyl-D-alanine carboxypeptidase [Oscillospiraceae bacterium]|nr:D-alanyl-D-alanine carboxypeptidase [Oscillospiraceae bacterium]
MKCKKMLSLLLALVLMASLIPQASAVESAPAVSAVSTIVVDAYTGSVIYENNADEKLPIASVTKIMTGYLACEGLNLDDEKLDEMYTVSQHAADADGTDGTSLYLLPGDRVSYEVLLYGTMLRSGNDAAAALAEACSGSEEAFIQRMNEKAAELGMENTHFASTNGLVDENNYSTARDLAKLSKVAMENELFAKVVGTWYIELGDFQIENHNELLSIMRGECLGIKTGFTTLAGRTLVSCAERDGSRFIIVTLNDSYDFADHEALYEWAFKNYPANVLCVKGDRVTTLRVGSQSVPLVAADTVVTASAHSSEFVIRSFLTLPGEVSGALAEGSVAGTITYTVNGEELATVDLLYGELLVS